MILGRRLKAIWKTKTIPEIMASRTLTLGFYHIRFRITPYTRDELITWLQMQINLGGK